MKSSAVKTKREGKAGPLVSPTPRKVFGRPLQSLYAQLIQGKNPPNQANLIRELCRRLDSQGLSYHPRTVKRQLLGSIEYIPEALEGVLVAWLLKQYRPGQKKIYREYQKDKKSLDSSEDQSLYVPPHFSTRMALGYMVLHKQLSRRRLALKLQEGLKNREINVGLETLQAALAGKTQKIRKVIEDELKGFFKNEGYKDRTEIESFLTLAEKEGGQSTERVEIENIEGIIDAYLFKSEGASKRQLALKIKDRLADKGFVYHLSSIQSVLEGKTRKTKRAILETIYELCRETGIEHPENIEEYLKTLPEAQRQRHHYISAEQIPEMVQQLTTKHPQLTRRQLALILREDLLSKGFDFSLNTLQYILGGKTKRTRQVVFELLSGYLKQPEFIRHWTEKNLRNSGRKGRPSLTHRVLVASHNLSQANETNRELLLEAFLATRRELIKSRWSRKFQRMTLRRTPRKPLRELFDESDLGPSSAEGVAQEGARNGDEAAFALDRLVS